jgi:transmembrane sensor
MEGLQKICAKVQPLAKSGWNMRTHTRELTRLIEEAQRWERTLKPGTPAERAAFAAWIRRSPEHLQAYLQHLSLQVELQEVDAAKNLDLDELLHQSSGNVVPLGATVLPRPESARRTRLRFRIPWQGYVAIAASALLILALTLAHVQSMLQWGDYATATGEQRRIVLPDGSIVELNTQSHIRVAYRAREVELLAGEAVFSVRHDENRPFRVRARGAMIEDLGTQFSIYVRPDASITVSVLDGSVQVSGENSPVPSLNAEGMATPKTGAGRELKWRTKPTPLAAGEKVHIDATGKLSPRAALNVAEAASWRQHQIWFEGASLYEVAADFNRYNTAKIQIITDPVLGQKRYTGTWNPYEPESFIQYLQNDPMMVVRREKDLTVIRAR